MTRILPPLGVLRPIIGRTPAIAFVAFAGIVTLAGCRAFEVEDRADAEERVDANGAQQDDGASGGTPRTATIGTGIVIDGLEITVDEAAFSRGFEFQEPPAGRVFVAYKVTARAVEGDHLVTGGGFTVTADGTRQGSSTFVVADSWEPLLTFVDLQEGNEITGWMVFEVPEPEEFLELEYESNALADGPDWFLRTRCCDDS